MARQVAALPKKKFELYRSKKILTCGDHSLFTAGTNQVLKDKLGTNSLGVNITMANSSIEKDISSIPQHQVDVRDSGEVLDSEIKPKNGKKKKKKSKKGKSANSTQEQTVTNTSTGEQDGTNLDMKPKVLSLENCSPLCVEMNSNLSQTDISTGNELKTVQNPKSNVMDSKPCRSSSSNDSGIVTPDSGLGKVTCK